MSASVMAVGTIGGPPLGGLITGHLGWRWAFYVNVPLGLLVLAWCSFLLQVPARHSATRIDWLGIGLLTTSITALVLLTTWGGSQYAWTSVSILALAGVAGLGLSAFVVSQRRAAEPVLPLRVFTNRNFTLASLLALVTGAMMFGAVLYLPLFQQTVQHATASSSGLLLLPLMVPVVMVSQIVGRVMSATDRYKVFPVLGTVCLATGMTLLSTMTTETGRVITGLYMGLIGIGLGFTQQITTTIAQNSVERTDLGVASSIVTLFRTLGASFGVAVFRSLFTHATTHQLTGAAHLRAVASGTHAVFLTAAALSLVAVVAALLIQEVPLRAETAPVPSNTSTDTPSGPG